MSTTPSTTVMPKRQHRTLDEARALVAAWRGSGQGKQAWCREHGLLRSTLSSCLYRLDEADAARPAPGTFIALRPPRAVHAAEVDQSPSPATVAIDLPSGLRITGLDARGVATVVRMLGEAP